MSKTPGIERMTMDYPVHAAIVRPATSQTAADKYVRDDDGRFAETPGGALSGIDVKTSDEYTKSYGEPNDERVVAGVTIRSFENGDLHVVLDLENDLHQVLEDLDADALRELADDIEEVLAEDPDDYELTGDDQNIIAEKDSPEHAFYLARYENGDVRMSLGEILENDWLDLGDGEAQDLADAMREMADSWEEDFADEVVTSQTAAAMHAFCLNPLHPGPCKGWKGAKAAGLDHTTAHPDLAPKPKVRRRKAAPAAQAVPPPAPAAEEAARARQAGIDAARSRADILAEVDEARINETDPATAQRMVAQAARRNGLADDPQIAALVAEVGHGDADGIADAMADISDSHRLQNIGSVNTQRQRFDPKQHQMVDGPAPGEGAEVDLVRPGYRMNVNGEDILLSKAVVELAADGPSIPRPSADPTPAPAARPRRDPEPKNTAAMVKVNENRLAATAGEVAADIAGIAAGGASLRAVRNRVDERADQIRHGTHRPTPEMLAAADEMQQAASNFKGRPAALAAEVWAIAARHGARPVGTPNTPETFDPRLHKAVYGGDLTGQQVVVVQSGVTADNGRLVTAQAHVIPASDVPAPKPPRSRAGDLPDVETKFRQMRQGPVSGDREKATELLNTLTTGQVNELADRMGLRVSGTKRDRVQSLVETYVGFRLDHDAIMRSPSYGDGPAPQPPQPDADALPRAVTESREVFDSAVQHRNALREQFRAEFRSSDPQKWSETARRQDASAEAEVQKTLAAHQSANQANEDREREISRALREQAQAGAPPPATKQHAQLAGLVGERIVHSGRDRWETVSPGHTSVRTGHTPLLHSSGQSIGSGPATASGHIEVTPEGLFRAWVMPDNGGDGWGKDFKALKSAVGWVARGGSSNIRAVRREEHDLSSGYFPVPAGTTQTASAAALECDAELAEFKMPEQLAESFLHGKAAAEVRLGTRGSFRRCQRKLAKEGVDPAKIDGACANIYKRATGRWPGRKKGEHSMAVNQVACGCGGQPPATTYVDELAMMPEPTSDLSPSKGWRGPLAPIDVATGDRRRFAPGSLMTRQLPLPVRWQKSQAKGHDGAVVVGALTGYTMDDNGTIHGEGYWLDPSVIPEVETAQYLVKHKLIGPSVDLEPSMQVRFEDPESGEKFEPHVCQMDGTCPAEPNIVIERGTIAGATLVPITAFAGAHAPETFDRTVADDVAYEMRRHNQTAAVRAAGWDGMPIADRGREWDAADAEANVMARVTKDDDFDHEVAVDWDTYAHAFLFRDEHVDPETKGAYKFPVATFIDGALTIVPRAVFAAAARLDSANISGPQKMAMREVIEDLYDQMAEEFDDETMQPPWDPDFAALDSGCGCADKFAAATQTAATDDECDGLNEFCRNPLHPGPCKGSKRKAKVTYERGRGDQPSPIPKVTRTPRKRAPDFDSATSDEVDEWFNDLTGEDWIKLSRDDKNRAHAAAVAASKHRGKGGNTAYLEILNEVETDAEEILRARRARQRVNTGQTAAADYGVFGDLDPYPAEAFDVELSGPTPLTVTEDGRVFGHAALWKSCNRGYRGVCVPPPRSHTGYAQFHLGAVRTTNGTLAVGKIVQGEGHPDTAGGVRVTRAYYDRTSKTVALVRAADDKWGLKVAGVVAPGTTPEEVTMLFASPPSGDWKDSELIAVLSVNVPGHVVPRATMLDGQPVNMVAAGRYWGDPEPDPILTMGAALIEDVHQRMWADESAQLAAVFS